MKKKFILLSLLLVMALMTGFSLLTIKNSRDCDQLVIDTYELISGIDIPEQTNVQCIYFEAERIRLGVYTLDDTQAFIRRYGLKQLNGSQNTPLWSQQFLSDAGVLLPAAGSDLFQLQGENKGNKWQCLVDRQSGNMWFEVEWKS